MTPRYSVEDARRFFALLARPGDVFELRGLSRVNGQQHVTSGFFDDIDKLVRCAIERSGKDTGVYVTINPVNSALLARSPKNCVHRAGNGDTTSDRDVRVRRSILVDVDPVRPAGISATDAEHAEAIAIAWQIAADFSEAGWPEPILADSGNGGHLVYAVDLPVDDGGLVKRVLEKLSKRYTTATFKVDEKVFNPARISKIYGTLTRKGEDTLDRPHRIASILWAPERLREISRETLEAFAPSAPVRELREKIDRYTGPEFDLDAWIARHLPDAIAMSWSEGRKWLLPVCPFNPEHDRKEAYVTQSHTGVIAAGCQHESCFKSWRQLRERFEPDAYERKNGNGQRLTDREPPHDFEFAEGSTVGERVVYEYPGMTADERAEIDAFAAREREPAIRQAKDAAPIPKWKRLPALVDEIWSRKDDPWVGLRLADDELCRVRAGGIVVVIGGSGSGKSSLVSNLLLQHARDHGPAIALSIELPADELAARIVGIKCDASWEDVLRGEVQREFMTTALALPRMFVLERKDATLDNLRSCIDAARDEYPNEPILVAIDYAQLIHSKEKEVRMRVSDAFERIDDVAREKRVVTIAVSQMGRAGAKLARDGERIGADAADLGAESAAIERFATATLTIGLKGEPREDGSAAVELSLGKGRMGGGDCVFPASYWGKSGLWRLAGEKKSAADVRAARETEREASKARALELQIVGAAHRASAPLSRNELGEMVQGRRQLKQAAIQNLIATGEIVEVAKRAKGSRKASWMVWVPDRVNATSGLQLVRDLSNLQTESHAD